MKHASQVMQQISNNDWQNQKQRTETAREIVDFLTEQMFIEHKSCLCISARKFNKLCKRDLEYEVELGLSAKGFYVKRIRNITQILGIIPWSYKAVCIFAYKTSLFS